MIMLYFSGTGNSKYIAKEFAAKMGCESFSIEEDINFVKIMEQTETIGVCYPIYGSCVPRIMREFAVKYQKAFANKKLIIFCTQMMFSGDGARAFARLLPGCESRVIYAEHFNMPNNISNFFLFPIGDKERVQKKKKADVKLEFVCNNIKNGIVNRRGFNAVSMILGKFQNIIYPILEEKRRGSFIADHDCIQCGQCIKCCPMKNLEMDKKGIKHKNNCILCYRCVNLCPKQAATVVIHIKPKHQYKGLED